MIVRYLHNFSRFARPGSGRIRSRPGPDCGHDPGPGSGPGSWPTACPTASRIAIAAASHIGTEIEPETASRTTSTNPSLTTSTSTQTSATLSEGQAKSSRGDGYLTTASVRSSIYLDSLLRSAGESNLKLSADPLNRSLSCTARSRASALSVSTLHP